ncbi:MAG: TrkA family potassium uptake protein [Myxococcales bacterium]|nr:TrkA family potassium uptake protein [Myxococcales bacterium]
MRRFAVFGLGRFGAHVAISLAELGADVLAIDIEEEKCEALKRYVGIHPLCFDATNENALKASGVDDVDTAVVAMGTDREASILVTALLRRLSIPRIVARAVDDLHKQILQLVGAGLVFNPEVEMAKRAAQQIYATQLHERLSLPTGHHLVEVDAMEPLIGKTLGELDLRRRMELTVIAIKSRAPWVDDLGESRFRVQSNLNPGADDRVEKGDTLVVIGTPARIREFLELCR